MLRRTTHGSGAERPNIWGVTSRTDTTLATGTWQVDPAASAVGFSVRHLGVATVRGGFGRFAGTLHTGPAGLRASGSVETASVDTGNGIRDGRLRGEFFAAGTFPHITLAAREPAPPRGGAIRLLAGELTIRNVARPVLLRLVVEPAEGDLLQVRCEGDLRRSDFGLDWAALREAGRLLVADRVAIRADLLLRRVAG
jgi:polyisoprenoid-binding protein YceI